MHDGGTVQRIADRYQVRELLGRGGMACVYRVTDLTTGREQALKQLQTTERGDELSSSCAAFEREFQTLAHLRHPALIEVYDYVVSHGGAPFYTMELLSGWDLSERAPLPWRDACGLLFEVCSALALLHSRRLLHRDVSPHNIRCTRAGGARLMASGAVTSMFAGTIDVCGTPACTPLEAVQHASLDGRADLYALGATLYFALTGRAAYPAHDVSELSQVWNHAPAPPSAWAPGIPRALDELCLSLLSLEPALRPQTAYEVMQRLSACAGLPPVEPVAVSQAYLATPEMVGREGVLEAVRVQLRGSRAGRGRGVLVRGPAGSGRSRVLDACALEAKTFGATVLRAACAGAVEAFGVVRLLARHLRQQAIDPGWPTQFPELCMPGAPCCPGEDDADHEQLQRAFCELLRAVSRSRPLLIVVDDAQRLDEASGAVLMTLLDAQADGQVQLLLAAPEPGKDEPSSLALRVLARRCDQVTLEPLTQAQTRALLASLFGHVPNVEHLSDEIYKVIHGNPRGCMEIAQHLVDHAVITYRAGTWVLPSAVSASDLPASAEDAMRARSARLSQLARTAAQAVALSFYQTLTHAELRALGREHAAEAIGEAVSELLRAGILTLGRRAHAYVLSSRLWHVALTHGLSQPELEERHRALAELYRGKSQLARIHHLFAANACEQGLDALLALHRQHKSHYDANRLLAGNVVGLVPAYQRALQSASALGRPAREIHEIRRWFMALSTATGDASHYWSTAAAWLEQLKRDSGFDAWQAAELSADAGQRITAALQHAEDQYRATPEAERVYRVDEAICRLVEYVVISIATACYSMDLELMGSLPALLEPFTPLSAAVHAIWQNVIATLESTRDCRLSAARARWRDVYEKLAAVTPAQMQHVEQIRSAVAYGICVCEVALGTPLSGPWLKQLDDSPHHALSALCLRKLMGLQLGDWRGAERLREQAEVASLCSPTKPMFTSLLALESSLYAKARDLVGLQDTIERIAPLARSHAGWRPFYELARARFELVRGDAAAALQRFDHCIAQSAPFGQPSPLQVWIGAQAGRAEACVALGRADLAHAQALAALAHLERSDALDIAADLIQATALVEARLGAMPRAIVRLDALIAAHCSRSVSGLLLGLAYEARARVAIWANDAEAFAHYALRTACEYRHTTCSPLRARYERLVQEAAQSGLKSPQTSCR